MSAVTVPIIDVRVPANPLVRASINFGVFGAYRGSGIAADGNHVYLTATASAESRPRSSSSGKKW